MRSTGIDVPDPEPGSDGLTKTQIGHEQAYGSVFADCTASTTDERGDRPITDAKRDEMGQWNEVCEKTADCLCKKGYDVEVLDGGYSWAGPIPAADSVTCAPANRT